MSALLAIFQIPIFLLNFFGFIGSAVWLLLIGEWRSVVIGVIISMVAPTLLGLALFPGIALAAPATYFAKKGLTIGVYGAGLLASMYTYALIGAWCGTITYYYLDDAAAKAFWPLLIWSYGVATAPWSYLAQRDQAVPSLLAAFFAQAGFIVVMAAVALGVSLNGAFQLFSLVMIVGIIFHMRILAEARREGLLG
jgi:hypothetical protein